VKVRPGKTSFKEVKRNKDDKFSLEIIEEYEGDYNKRRFIYKSKDSISNISYYYKNKKEVVRFYKTLYSRKNSFSNQIRFFIQTVMREFQQLRLRLILMFKKLDQKNIF
jgi:hypothetical protein